MEVFLLLRFRSSEVTDHSSESESPSFFDIVPREIFGLSKILDDLSKLRGLLGVLRGVPESMDSSFSMDSLMVNNDFLISGSNFLEMSKTCILRTSGTSAGWGFCIVDTDPGIFRTVGLGGLDTVGDTCG